MNPTLPSIAEPSEARPLIDVLGPTLEFLLPPGSMPTAYCIALGTIPPEVIVPLHSHLDDESFFQLRGSVETAIEVDGRFDWRRVSEGEFVHIPGGVKHAWRNVGDTPAVQLLTLTPRLARFLLDVGRAIPRGSNVAPPPTAGELRRFAEVSMRYGYWLGGDEDNSAIGLRLTPPSRGG